MIKYLRFTLLTDGSSDRMLLQPLAWLLRHHFPDFELEINYADLSRVSKTVGLTKKIKSALALYPCDLLFIHRDAEGMNYEDRKKEIAIAYAAAEVSVPYVEVIPVRMTEAWMMHDRQAIRLAADNPNGKVRLNIPSPNTLHRLTDPKADLEQLLRSASELSRRRLKKFRARQRMHRLAELIEDFSPLRQQASFTRLEAEIVRLKGEWTQE